MIIAFLKSDRLPLVRIVGFHLAVRLAARTATAAGCVKLIQAMCVESDALRPARSRRAKCVAGGPFVRRNDAQEY